MTTIDHIFLLERLLQADEVDLAAALVVRGRLALADTPVPEALDRRLAALCDLAPSLTLPAEAAVLRGLRSGLATAAEHAPMVHPAAEEAVTEAVSARDGWHVQALALDALGKDTAGHREAVQRFDAVVRDGADALSVLAETAAGARAASPIPDQSAWALFPESVSLRGAGWDPADVFTDDDLADYLEGTATPLLAAMLDHAMVHSQRLRARMEALDADLARFEAGVEVDTLAPPPPTASTWSLPPPRPAVCLQPAAGMAMTGHPRFDAPAEGTLAWAFSDGSGLFVETHAERWLVTLSPAGADPDVALSCTEGEVWTDETGLSRCLARRGELTARAGIEVHRLVLPERAS